METACDLFIVFFLMGIYAVFAAFNTLLRVEKLTAALFSKHIKGAITEQAVKVLFGNSLMAWKVFTIPVLKKTAAVFSCIHI
jgi:hypothetical protein